MFVLFAKETKEREERIVIIIVTSRGEEEELYTHNLSICCASNRTQCLDSYLLYERNSPSTRPATGLQRLQYQQLEWNDCRAMRIAAAFYREMFSGPWPSRLFTLFRC